MRLTQEPAGGNASDSPPPPMPPPPAPPTSPPAADLGLFRGVRPTALSLGTAIEVAFRALAKPVFVIPIFVIAIVINAITEVLLGPTLDSLQDLTATPTIDEIRTIVGALAVSLVISLIGGAIAAIYGTVWAVAASVGPSPTFADTMGLVRQRWAKVLGASALVGVLTFGLLVLGGLAVALLSQMSAALAFGLAMALLVALVWLVARLSMTTWLAADGVAVTASLRQSWRITEGSVLRIIGWTFAYGFLFALVSGAAGVVLGRVPYVGQGIATGLTLALSYGAGVTLYRRTRAGAPPAAAEPQPPSVGDTPFG